MMRIGITIAMVLAFWPTMVWYIKRTTDGSDEPWGLAALVVGIALLFVKRNALQITNRGIYAAITILIVYMVGFQFLPPMIRAILGLLCFALLSGSLRKIPAVWAVLGLSLPVIASLQFYIGYPMRLVASVSAEAVLNLFNMDVIRKGTDLWRAGNVVGVDPPCSGVEMLWVGLFMVSCYAAWMNWRLAATGVALVAGFALVVAGNTMRVILLYFKESGILDLPEWTHEGIGVVIFSLLIFLLGGRKQQIVPRKQPSVSIPRLTTTAVFAAACFAGLAPLTGGYAGQVNKGGEDVEFPGWPERWEGKYLESIPLSATEQRFAEKLPGKMAVFSTGPEKVIYRWVTRPTRLLHSSAVCLKASGFQIEKERSGTFIALGPEDGIYLVEERIFNQDESWPEISQWYWKAALGKTEGSWWAVTVIRPIGNP